MPQGLSTNTFTVAPLVVSADPTQGTHTTVQAAINSATAGDIIYVRQGTYTENLTLKAGVLISAIRGSGRTPNVSIVGNATFTGAGIATLSNLRMQTNGAALLSVTGVAASIVNCINIDFVITNSTGILFSSSNAGAQLNLVNCSGDISGAVAFFAHSSAGVLDIRYSEITNSANSTQQSTASAGQLNFRWSRKSTPLVTSGTNATTIIHSILDCTAINQTAMTLAGTANTSFSRFLGGTASAISVAGTLSSRSDAISSSNVNAITGAGTLNYSGTVFTSTSTTVNTTTRVGVGQPNANGTAGQVLTAVGSGAIPTYQAVSGGGMTWVNQTSDLNPLVKSFAYQANKVTLLVLTLPTGGTFGDTIRVQGFGAGGWILNAGAGQTIQVNAAATTAAGSVAFTNRYDYIQLTCSTTTTTWFATSSGGNLTLA